MIYFRNSTTDKEGVSIFSAEEMFSMGMDTSKATLICKGFYLSAGTNLEQLTKAINLEAEGVFDFAVPQKWAEENNFPVAVWFYSYTAPNRLLGRPFHLAEMIDRLRKILFERAMTIWHEKVKVDSDE